MGSKGSQTVQQSGNQTQTYTPNPQIGAAGGQAIGMATTAAGAPFQQPVAPVAPFTPFQSIGFGETLGLQGMAQPYFNTAGNYLAGSAAPVSAADVANYYNPMAANVTAQMQNIFGQQNVQNTGNLVQSAGGVGADRVAVGQANMANQQALAAGQTYAGLYQQALAAAEQNKQMQAGAGFAFGQMGPAAQAAQQNAVNQLLGVGAQQQGLTQQELNAIYQNQLARIAYPFQTGQYLAGITGGLAPAMGGTTTGQFQNQTTYPAPSGLAQALGLGAAGLGLMGQFGGIPGMSAMGLGAAGAMPFGSAMQYLPGGSAYGATPSYQNGGYYPMFDEGGAVNPDYGDLAKREKYQEYKSIIPAAAQGNPAAETFLHDVGYDDGGSVQGFPSFNLQGLPSNIQGLASNPQNMSFNPQGLPPNLQQLFQRWQQHRHSMPMASTPMSSPPMQPPSMQTPSMSDIPPLSQPQAIMPNVQLPSGPQQSSPFMPASAMQGTLSPKPLGLPNFDDGGSVDIPVGQASPMSLTIDPTNRGLPEPGAGKVSGSPVPQIQLPQGQSGRYGPGGVGFMYPHTSGPSMPSGGGQQSPMGGGLGGSLGQLGQLGGSIGKLFGGLGGGAGAGASAGMDFSAATDLGLGDIGAAAAEYAPELALALANRGGRMDTGGATTDTAPHWPRNDDPDFKDWLRQQQREQMLDPKHHYLGPADVQPDDTRDVPMSADGGSVGPPMDIRPDVAKPPPSVPLPRPRPDQPRPFHEWSPGHERDYAAAGGAVDPMRPGEGYGEDDGADAPFVPPTGAMVPMARPLDDWLPRSVPISEAPPGSVPELGLGERAVGNQRDRAPTMATPAMVTPKDTAQVPMGDVPLPTPKPVQTVAIKPDQSPAPMGPRPYPEHPLDPNDPNYDPKLDPHNAAYDPDDPRLVYADPMGHGDPNAPAVGGGRYAPGMQPQDPMAGPMGSAMRYGPMGPSRLPFPNATDPNNIARRWTMSPWAALTNAGVAMATSRGPIGSVLATGIGAAGKTFAGQQQELNSEQAINDKAAQLLMLAENHLRSYAHQDAELEETKRYHTAMMGYRNTEQWRKFRAALDNPNNTDWVGRSEAEKDEYADRMVTRASGQTQGTEPPAAGMVRGKLNGQPGWGHKGDAGFVPDTA